MKHDFKWWIGRFFSDSLKRLVSGLFISVGFALGIYLVMGFQTMGTAPSTTGPTLASNQSTGSYLAMRGRAPCGSATALVYEDKCLDTMTWTAANRATCLAKKNTGWIDVNPEHLNAIGNTGYMIWSYYGGTGTYAAYGRYGFRPWTATAVGNNGGNAYYGNYTWLTTGSVPNYYWTGISANAQWNATPASPIVDASNISADNASVYFTCAWFRDLGN